MVESHGFVGKGATKVLDEVAKYASDNYSVQRAELAGYLRRRVAIALQRGNGLLDRTAVRASRNSYGAALAMGMVSVSSDSAFITRSRAKASARSAVRAKASARSASLPKASARSAVRAKASAKPRSS